MTLLAPLIWMLGCAGDDKTEDMCNEREGTDCTVRDEYICGECDTIFVCRDYLDDDPDLEWVRAVHPCKCLDDDGHGIDTALPGCEPQE
ncbi:MAG: hypothetical protein ACOZNI_17695 [Myxococcota bacterium]